MRLTSTWRQYHWLWAQRLRASLVGVLASVVLGSKATSTGIGLRITAVHQVSCSGGATTISPCGTSADTLADSATGTRQFSVQNASANDHTYTPSCSVTTPLSSCTVAPTPLLVSAGGTATVAVTYVASSTIATGAQGTVIVAIDGGAPDQVATVIAVSTPSTDTSATQ
jgi:hypothetical protein